MSKYSYTQVCNIINDNIPIEVILDRARDGKTFVCPDSECRNGTGKTGIGIDGKGHPNKDGKIKYHCFSCGKDFDKVDLIKTKYGVKTLDEIIEQAISLYPLLEAYIPVKSENKKIKKENETYIKNCEQDNDFSYLKSRGISEKTQRAFHVGLDKENNRCVIPYTKDYYVCRTLNKNAKKRYLKATGEIPTVFNEKALIEDDFIFVTEGEIDALSIEELGYKAISIGSANNKKLLYQALEKRKSNKPLILLLDSDEAGKQASEDISKELTELYILSIKREFLIYKDANEFLISDKAGLKEFLEESVNLAFEYFKEALLKNNINSTIERFKSIEQETYREYKTGFKCFDEENKNLFGGLHEGLFIVGAVSSFGKTTFCLQLAEEIAFRGEDVIFFSLEQDRMELVSKGLSRRTYLNNQSGSNANLRKSNIQIMNKNLYKFYSLEERAEISKAISQYQKEEQHLHIYEGRYKGERLNVNHIKEIVRSHVAVTKNYPVIFIDYLQIIAPDNPSKNETDKQRVDNIVFELKELSRELHIPVVAISSFNRESYYQPVSMTSFKESGAVEYSSDILIGFEPFGWNTRSKNRAEIIEKIKEENERRTTDENKQPVGVHMNVLKNRNGRKFHAYFLYNYAYNNFEEVTGEELEEIYKDCFATVKKKSI